MKRFDATSTMIEEENGLYVRYTDAEDEIEALRKERKELGQLLLEGRNLMAESITEIEALKLQNKSLKSELSFYDSKCSECHSVLGLLAESECPLCTAREETEKYAQLWLDLVDKNTANANKVEELKAEIEQLRELLLR